MKVTFAAELYRWDARRSDTWVFVNLPAEESQEIRDLAGGLPRGFGSLRVRAEIGTTAWRTSIFPDKAGHYVLPLKRAVRDAESLDIGDTAQVTVALVDFS